MTECSVVSAASLAEGLQEGCKPPFKSSGTRVACRCKGGVKYGSADVIVFTVRFDSLSFEFIIAQKLIIELSVLTFLCETDATSRVLWWLPATEAFANACCGGE